MDLNADRIQQLFAQAMLLTPSERAALLDHECADEPEVRKQVESLLRAHDGAGAFLDSPTLPPPTRPDTGSFFRPMDESVPPVPIAPPQPEHKGVRIDRYEIVGVVGEGGFGFVYLARQLEPIQRDVALKILKPSAIGTRIYIEYFKAEQQLMAMLAHPNIAAVFDAGQTEDGRPYLVMEYIRGASLSRYCRDERLTVRQRLELMLQVCRGVYHAHQSGVIHRDLKPSNILVATFDGRPEAKVIDFGIARAIEVPGGNAAAFAAYRAAGGTMQYLSPEQADLDTASGDVKSDVYALGIVLFELLTESTPITARQMRSSSRVQLMELIKTEPQPAVRSRLSSEHAAAIEKDPDRAARLLAASREITQEVEWVVSKAISKDRDERYETVRDFAADIERLLTHQAVQAGPNTRRYRVRKFLRRHRGAAVAVTLLLSALIGGTITTTIEAVRERAANVSLASEIVIERAARQQAVESAVKATAASRRAGGFSEIIQRAISIGNPLSANTVPLSAADLITNIRGELDAAPDLGGDVEGPIDSFVATALLNNGGTASALAYAQRGYAELHLTLPGSDEELQAHVILTYAEQMAGHRAEARQEMRALAPRMSGEPRPSHETRRMYNNVLFLQAFFDQNGEEAAEVANVLADDAARQSNVVSPTVIITRLQQAFALMIQAGAKEPADPARQDLTQQAAELLHQTRQDAEHALGPDHGTTLAVDVFDVALRFRLVGPKDTTADLLQLLPRIQKLYGENSPMTAVTYLLLGFCNQITGHSAAASGYLDRFMLIQNLAGANPGPFQNQTRAMASLLGDKAAPMMNAIRTLDSPEDGPPPDISAAQLDAFNNAVAKASEQTDHGDMAGVLATLGPVLKQTPLWKNATRGQLAMYIGAYGLAAAAEIALNDKDAAEQLMGTPVTEVRRVCPDNLFARATAIAADWRVLLMLDRIDQAAALLDREWPSPSENDPPQIRDQYFLMKGVSLFGTGHHADAQPFLERVANSATLPWTAPNDFRHAVKLLVAIYRETRQEEKANRVAERFDLNGPTSQP